MFSDQSVNVQENEHAGRTVLKQGYLHKVDRSQYTAKSCPCWSVVLTRGSLDLYRSVKSVGCVCFYFDLKFNSQNLIHY